MKLFDKKTDRMLGMPLPFFMIAVLLVGLLAVIPVVLSPKTTVITTQPPGAKVYARSLLSIGGERVLCATTPCEVSFNRMQTQIVGIELDGYRGVTVIVNPAQRNWDKRFKEGLKLRPLPIKKKDAEGMANCDAAIASGDFPTAAQDNAEPTPCYRIPPRIPRRAKASGHCHADFDITMNGVTDNIRISGCTAPIFTAASRASVRRWRYYPARDNGANVPYLNGSAKITFRLSDQQGNLIPEADFDVNDPLHKGDLETQ